MWVGGFLHKLQSSWFKFCNMQYLEYHAPEKITFRGFLTLLIEAQQDGARFEDETLTPFFYVTRQQKTISHEAKLMRIKHLEQRFCNKTCKGLEAWMEICRVENNKYWRQVFLLTFFSLIFFSIFSLFPYCRRRPPEVSGHNTNLTWLHGIVAGNQKYTRIPQLQLVHVMNNILFYFLSVKDVVNIISSKSCMYIYYREYEKVLSWKVLLWCNI